MIGVITNICNTSELNGAGFYITRTIFSLSPIIFYTVELDSFYVTDLAELQIGGIIKTVLYNSSDT